MEFSETWTTTAICIWKHGCRARPVKLQSGSESLASFEEAAQDLSLELDQSLHAL
jgi:hypothetical protein